MDVLNKDFVGIIKDLNDDRFPTKYAVFIPELTQNDQIILVENRLNKYLVVKDGSGFGVNDGSTAYSGSYFPLHPGTKVNIKFSNNDLTSGYIESLHFDNVGIPPNQSKDNYYLALETPSGARIYVDDDKKRLHLSNAGMTDIFMDEESIILQTSKNNTRTSSMELSANGFIIRFGSRSIVFNDSGFVVNNGDTSNTFFHMTEKGISMKGEEFLTMDTNKLDIRGQSTNIQSMGNFNIRGTVLNLTGTQKAALNSAVVHVEGWMSTYLKAGLTLNIESKVLYRSQSLIKDETNLAISHVYSSVDSKESTISAETSTFKANAISTIANDGIILNNLGIATAIAPSLATSITGVTNAMHIGFGVFGTFLSFDNIASAVVGTVLTDSLIADNASVASPKTYSMAGIFSNSSFDAENFLNKLNKNNISARDEYSKGVLNYNNLNKGVGYPSVSYSATTTELLNKPTLTPVSSNLL